MSLVVTDSFGHYDVILSKWDLKGDNQIVLGNAGLARTNAGTLQILSGASGPARVLPAHFTALIAEVAYNLDTTGAGEQATVLQLRVSGVGYNLAVRVNSDSSLSVWRGNPGDGGSVELIRAPFRCFVWTTWNYIIISAVFSDTVGSFTLWCNGRQIASLSGIRTTAQPGTQYCDEIQLYGAQQNGSLSFLADFVLLDPLTSPNTAPLPSPKVYVTVPNANGAPIGWVPVAGTNFANVSDIPPDGDTSYNSATTVGQLDQYLHPLSAPSDADIVAVQHCLDLKMAVDSLEVSSVVAGTVGPAFAVTNAYKIWLAQYDNDPASLSGFVPGDFPLAAGPEVTA